MQGVKELGSQGVKTNAEAGGRRGVIKYYIYLAGMPAMTFGSAKQPVRLCKTGRFGLRYGLF